MSVDLDAEPSTPEPDPVAAPEPVAPPEPPPDPDEAQAVEIQGGKHVPLSALKGVREELKQAKAQAERVVELERQNAQMQGSLATFQQLQQTLQQRPPTSTAPVEADPELLDLARSLDYYQPDGTPDVTRAAKHAAIIERRAQKIAAAQIAPLQQHNARAQSAANYQAARAMQSPQGDKPSEQMLNWMWQNLPAEYTADPRVAQALPALALGIERLQGNGSKLPPQPPAPLNPPLHTEGLAGGPVRRAAPMTDAERDIIRARGMKEESYLAHTKNFVKGRPTSLEDD